MTAGEEGDTDEEMDFEGKDFALIQRLTFV